MYKRRQVLASASYHAETAVKTVPDGTAAGQLLKWNATTSAWEVSEVGTLASGDILKWDGSKWLKLTPTQITVVTDVQFDTTNHVIQKKTRTADVIAAGTESSWTTITGGAADPFST